MMRIMATLAMLILVSCSQVEKKYEDLLPLPETLEGAVNNYARDRVNIPRDRYQHPFETLDFFGVAQDMTIVEISPGAGYYTEILAPFLAKNGQYVIAVPRLPSRPPAIMIENEKKLQNILIRHQEVQTKTRIVPFEPISRRNKIQREFADMVLTFNNVHNWMATHSTDMAFKFFHAVLKPGGVLGITQHRIEEGKKNRPKSGYMTEKAVIALARKGGFKFVGKSEINANPKDTADYPKGVWTLAPFYRLGEKDKDKYTRIGESDRMTLKFVKE